MNNFFLGIPLSIEDCVDYEVFLGQIDVIKSKLRHNKLLYFQRKICKMIKSF